MKNHILFRYYASLLLSIACFSYGIITASAQTNQPIVLTLDQHAAKIGGLLTVTLTNVPAELIKQQDTNKIVLLLNGLSFRNLCHDIQTPSKGVDRIQFQLAFGATNRPEWSAVLSKVWLGNKPSVGVILADNSEYQAATPLNLVAMDTNRKWLSLGLVLLFGYIFLYLATQTEMIRDPERPLSPSLAARAAALVVPSAAPIPTRPKNDSRWIIAWALVVTGVAFCIITLDNNLEHGSFREYGSILSELYFFGILAWIFVHWRRYWVHAKGAAADLRTYSLARTQMAIWFFLIVCSWVFLWLVTGTLDTLTNTVLALMGIGAGTALGAEAQDSGKPSPAEAIETKIKELEAKQKAGTALPSDLQDLANLQAQLTITLQPNPCVTKNFFDDVLTDNDGISFHRFQMFVWTIVLALVFITQVCQDLAMPDFNTTLLALMGISSGTYLGFMIKEPHATQR